MNQHHSTTPTKQASTFAEVAFCLQRMCRVGISIESIANLRVRGPLTPIPAAKDEPDAILREANK